MKKFLIIFIFIAGCSSNKFESTNNSSDIKFSDNLSLEEFKIKLNDYAQNSPYPNIVN
ncbi:hypothetical protein N9T44_01370 [Candidatus Pelagibacter sp.]|nr:hypothetical protein [Candidatus Pelagibacter sp.]